MIGYNTNMNFAKRSKQTHPLCGEVRVCRVGESGLPFPGPRHTCNHCGESFDCPRSDLLMAECISMDPQNCHEAEYENPCCPDCGSEDFTGEIVEYARPQEPEWDYPENL